MRESDLLKAVLWPKGMELENSSHTVILLARKPRRFNNKSYPFYFHRLKYFYKSKNVSHGDASVGIKRYAAAQWIFFPVTGYSILQVDPYTAWSCSFVPNKDSLIFVNAHNKRGITVDTKTIVNVLNLRIIHFWNRSIA